MKQEEIIRLPYFIGENIDEKELARLFLEPADFTDAERQKAWGRYVSGSKIKSILTKPLSVLAYYMKLIGENELDKKLRSIPRMNFYRDYGSDTESMIVNWFNKAIVNEWKAEQQDLVLRDILINSEQVYQIRRLLAPSVEDKTLIKVDKRSFILDVADNVNIMANIDGFTTNEDGTLRHIVEIKTKNGEIGGGALDTSEGLYDMHMDQIAFYHHAFNPTEGAILLTFHVNRGYKVHVFKKHELQAHWARIAPKIGKFLALYQEFLKPEMDKEAALAALEAIDFGDENEEVVTRKQLIEQIERLSGGIYGS